MIINPAALGQLPPKFTLCMIVRDEAHCLPRCLNSVRDRINRYIIADTGSTDGTPNIARTGLRDIPGEVFSIPWRDDFAWARNQVLDRIRGSEWLLWMDADEELHGEIRALDLADTSIQAYQTPLRYEDKSVTKWPNLFHASQNFRFRWPIHEELTHPNGQYRVQVLKKAWLTTCQDGARSLAPGKLEREVQHLIKAWRSTRHPRFLWFLGREYGQLGELAKSRACWQARLRWEPRANNQERAVAWLQLGRTMEAQGEDPMAVITAYFNAYEEDPSRVEGLGHAGMLLRSQGKPRSARILLERALEMPPSRSTLCVETSWQEWRIADELAIVYAQLGGTEQAINLLGKVLQACPENQKERVRLNLDKMCAAYSGGQSPKETQQ